ncbi:glycoside hydrolase family 2 TIM barrel-domain containing protein [Salinimicrobium sp. GXAS 041]|uniref:glycoside hydrolase family 2 TIM barrel-domain containing protein n=1 Tax=Salinimicrobium sp. GXAS 041 TaxID=3400806 RepID=UPI003C74049D
MRKKIQVKILFLVLCGSMFFAGCQTINRLRGQEENESPRIEENFGKEWQFQRLDDSSMESSSWEIVNIPHSARIEPLVVNDQWQGTAVYRKNFPVEALRNEKWFFHFEGVMQEARISINDSLITTHKGGYLPFTVDATPYLLEGQENSIEVEVINVDNPVIPPGKPLNMLDFNLFGGIYRDVYLVKTSPVHITDPVHANVVNGGGVLVHFDKATEEFATGIVKAHIKNDSQLRQQVSLRVTFEDRIGQVHNFTSRDAFVEAGEAVSISEEIAIDKPFLWSPYNPYLYKVKVEVISDGEVVDLKRLKTGIRDIELTEEAFFINGNRMFINGTNRHQEYPYVGYALSDQAHYRDAFKIKQAGFDFVRLSHYPQDPAFLEACDELGLMVMNAIPGWQYYEEGEFVENSLQDIKDMARRDRNHPSVIFWENSLNESGMTEEFMLRANEVLRAELPYEGTYTAGWKDHPSYDLFIPARQHAQPPYYYNYYDEGAGPLFIAEYGDWEYYAQNAGFSQDNFSDLEEEERTSRQLRKTGERGMLQQALNFQEAFNSNLEGIKTVGQANWLMFDYNRGYANNLEASGIADIFRIPKFAYYFYKSQKAPFTDEFAKPMVFIANYWTPESTKKIKVFSNTQEVALYLNDELIDRKEPELNAISDELPYPPFEFEVDSFEAGSLRAVGFINDKEVASHRVRTPGKAAKIDLAVDHSGRYIATNTPDVVFVYAIIRDAKGTVVPSAKNLIRFSIEEGGEYARLIGGEAVTAEAGIATVLLRTESFTEPIVLKAFSEGLGETEIIIEND